MLSALSRLLPVLRRLRLVSPRTFCAGTTSWSPAAGPTRDDQGVRPSHNSCGRRCHGWPEEPEVGFRTHPGRADRRPIPSRRLHGVRVAGRGDRPRTQRSGPTWRQFLAAQAHTILASTSRTSTRSSCAASTGSWPSSTAAADAHRRDHRAPHRRLGHPASPQLAHGPRRHRPTLPIPHPRSRRQVHRRVRRRRRRRRCQGAQDTDPAPRANAIAERFIGTCAGSASTIS